MNEEFEQLREQALSMERDGQAVKPEVLTNFPKGLPPSGIAYSLNFSRCQRDGMFAIQTKG